MGDGGVSVELAVRADSGLGDGQGSGIWHLAVWGDRVACGCTDGGIRVWSLETLGPERTLRGHEGRVYALAVSGGRITSSSNEGTVLVWSFETCGGVQTVQAYPSWSSQHIGALAVCGSALVGGSVGWSASEEREVRVSDLETLWPLHALRQPARGNVFSLVSDGREVWGVLGRQVVVWGRRGVTGGGA